MNMFINFLTYLTDVTGSSHVVVAGWCTTVFFKRPRIFAKLCVMIVTKTEELNKKTVD